MVLGPSLLNMMWMDVGMGNIDGVGDMNGNWGARSG